MTSALYESHILAYVTFSFSRTLFNAAGTSQSTLDVHTQGLQGFVYNRATIED